MLRNQNKKIGIVRSIIFVLVVLLITLVKISFPGGPSHIGEAAPTQRMRAEFANIEVPSNAEISSEGLVILRKPGTAAISADYLYRGSGQSISDIYAAELLRNGWRRGGAIHYLTGERYGSWYCKDGLAASLEITKSTDPNDMGYEFSIEWGSPADRCLGITVSTAPAARQKS